MTDADILLNDVIKANEPNVVDDEAISILNVICEALTGSKITPKEGNQNERQWKKTKL